MAKKVTLNELAGRALATSREYSREVNLYSTAAFLKAVEAKATREKGVFNTPFGRVTVAQNTTGRGETVRVFSPDGKERLRIFFSSNKFKFPNMISLGAPARRALEGVGLNINNIEHYIHKNTYIFTPAYGKVFPYIMKYLKGE